MKPLKKFLNTKSKWHPNKEPFPEERDYQKVLDFLNKKGFKIIPQNEYVNSSYSTMEEFLIDKAERSLQPIFMGDGTYWIRFCNFGKISKENPIFCITFKYVGILGFMETNEGDRNNKVFDTYEEAVEEINKCYNWK